MFLYATDDTAISFLASLELAGCHICICCSLFFATHSFSALIKTIEAVPLDYGSFSSVARIL